MMSRERERERERETRVTGGNVFSTYGYAHLFLDLFVLFQQSLLLHAADLMQQSLEVVQLVWQWMGDKGDR